MESSVNSVFALILNTKSIDPLKREEFFSLIHAAGLEYSASHEIQIHRPHPRYFIRQGNLMRLKQFVTDKRIERIIVSIDLAANQHKNLERFIGMEIWDRTALILDVFARRARTHQGKLQVELARLEYKSTRLVRSWTHLERQRGAIGQRGGPGEKQLEMDRRVLRARVGQLKKKLCKLQKQRQLGRIARQRVGLPTISLVGYTNAGKSTIFNALTGSDALASHQLFATLDPTIRRVRWDMGNFLLADTVGFIEDLSTPLLEAFAATLGEIKDSALVVHILDMADDDSVRKGRVVRRMLTYIGVEPINCLTVYNKIDIHDMTARIEYDRQEKPQCLWVSAEKSCGMDLLSHAINVRLTLLKQQKEKERYPLTNLSY